MSQYPPPQPPYQDQDVMSYSAVPPKTSGMALAAMILGIVAIPMMCAFGLGLVLGMVGLILGIISLISINREPQRLSGKGYAIAGIVTGSGSLLLLPLLIAILLPSLGKSRELANRATCAANLRGIMQSMVVYSADNDECYPIDSVTYHSTLASAAPMPTTGNISQNMYELVGIGMVAPQQFLCRSDPGPVKPSAIGGSNFSNDFAYSYSVAFPWSNKGIGGWWKNSMDAGVPIMADLAPANGTGSPVTNTLGGLGRESNSFNHQRDGQNVAFGDAHAEFVRNAACGEGGDNIYSSNGTGGPSPRGTKASDAGNHVLGAGTQGNWDVVLVPAADANAGYTRK
jgi:hypothetical protein